MLHIILGILKITGLILIAVLLLLLGIALAVLFAPVRYRGSVTKTVQRTGAQIRITWLLHLVSILFSFDLQGCRRMLEIRIFGVRTSDWKQFFARMFKFRKKKKKADDELEKLPDQMTEQSYESDDISEKPETPELSEKMTDVSETPETSEATEISETPETSETAEIPETPETSETAEIPETTETSEATEISEKSEAIPDPNDREKQSEKISLRKEIRNFRYKVDKICDKIKRAVSSIRQKIRDAWRWLQNTVQAVQMLLRNTERTLQKIGRLPGRVSDFIGKLEEYEAKELAGVIWKELMHLLKCFGPRKMEGYLRFGTGDPALTGKLTGLIYMMLPAGADKFSVEPDFAEQVFETDVKISGHVRACHAAAAAWRLFRNKKLRRLIAKVRKKGD